MQPKWILRSRNLDYERITRKFNIDPIVAKVIRDRQMIELDRLYPDYGFARNKGYGTKEHIEALKRIGPCPVHRRSFITHFI